MKVISLKNALCISKPEGINVRYYLFDEYEVHYNEQLPHTAQTWHRHEKIWETIYIIEGKLLAKWKEDVIEREQIIKAGDLVETENTSHNFINNTDKLVKFLVIKQVLSGESKRELLTSDKVLEAVNPKNNPM